MKFLFPLFLLAACAGSRLSAATPFTAFRDGEVFTYRVGFAIFPHAGDIIISAHDDKTANHD
ncbi:MAG: hypothetical protein ACHQ5A_07915, partial [Opitutales bacterium]